jgi:hypothetical protein
MKKQLLFTILLSIILIASCSNREKRIADDSLIQNPTPEILNNDRDKKVTSISRSYRSDIVQELYQEAINKNDKLKLLNSRINEIDGIKDDSLELYNKFIQTNRSYYETVNDYINQISDSTIKNELKEFLKVIENKYKGRVSKLVTAVEAINSKTKLLNDQVILLKLLITEPMMRNYQINESPKIETINELGKMYDSLIKDVKPYTVINK